MYLGSWPSELMRWEKKYDIYMDLGTAPPPKFLISHLIPAPFPFSFHATCSLTLLRLPVYLLVPMFSSDPPAWFHFLCHSAQILSPTTLATPATGTTLSWTFSFLIRLPWKPPSVGHNHLPSHSWGGRNLLDKATQHPFLCPQLILSPAPESLPYISCFPFHLLPQCLLLHRNS